MTTLSEKDLTALLLLNRLGIEGRRKALELFSQGKTPEEILPLFRSELAEVQKDFNPEKELALCWEKKAGFLTVLDPLYPASLKEIPDPPLLLYVKGEILESDRDALAVVGTRHPSFYGRTQAKKFAGELAAKGLTIVSGLARGIDQTAHEAALGVPYGRTLAVLGSGVDVIYPKENEKLYYGICERGAVLSEYSFGTPPLAENFPRRNRILSGLSLGVFVVEAHSRSGSLITAHQALDQGREVFALPGPVDQLTSRGTHQLLKEGAGLVESPDEIFEALAVHLHQKRNPEVSTITRPNLRSLSSYRNSSMSSPHALSGDPMDSRFRGNDKTDANLPNNALSLTSEKEEVSFVVNDKTAAIEEVLKEEGPLGTDEILDITGLEPSELPGLLLKLELAGRVRRGQDGKYSLFH